MQSLTAGRRMGLNEHTKFWRGMTACWDLSRTQDRCTTVTEKISTMKLQESLLHTLQQEFITTQISDSNFFVSS